MALFQTWSLKIAWHAIQTMTSLRVYYCLPLYLFSTIFLVYSYANTFNHHFAFLNLVIICQFSLTEAEKTTVNLVLEQTSANIPRQNKSNRIFPGAMNFLFGVHGI